MDAVEPKEETEPTIPCVCPEPLLVTAVHGITVPVRGATWILRNLVEDEIQYMSKEFRCRSMLSVRTGRFLGRPRGELLKLV